MTLKIRRMRPRFPRKFNPERDTPILNAALEELEQAVANLATDTAASTTLAAHIATENADHGLEHADLNSIGASDHHTAFVQADHDALANPHHSNANDHAQSHTHASHTGIGADDHHAQSHALDSHTGTLASVDAHLADTVDAHDASAVSFVAGGSIAGTDVQTALAEVATDYIAADAAHAAAGDPHTGYVREVEFDAKGDLLVGTGNNTLNVLGAGADDTILMADTAAGTTGLKWASPATPSTQAFGDAAAAGTGDTFTRGDHKHAMPANPVTAHEAAGDPHTGYATDTDLSNHTGDTVDAHDASAISVADSGGLLAATEVESALAELSARHKFVRKTATESVTSSATSQNDDDLFFSVGAGETWVIDVVLYYDAGTAGDIRVQLAYGAGGVGVLAYTVLGASSDVAAFSIAGFVQRADAVDSGHGGDATDRTLWIKGLLRSSEADTLRVKWGQLVSDGTATRVFADSFIMAHRVA